MHATDHFRIAGKARIRQSQRGGNAVSGHVERAEAQAVGNLGRDHVVDSGGGDEPLAGQGLPQFLSLRHRVGPSFGVAGLRVRMGGACIKNTVSRPVFEALIRNTDLKYCPNWKMLTAT